MYDYLSLNRFQPFNTDGSALRLVCAMLLQKTLFGEMNNSVMLLSFLKRQKLHKDYKKGVFMNVLLATM